MSALQVLCNHSCDDLKSRDFNKIVDIQMPSDADNLPNILYTTDGLEAYNLFALIYFW